MDAHDDTVDPRQRVVGIPAGTTPRKRFLHGAQIGDFVRRDAIDWRDVTPSAGDLAQEPRPPESPLGVVALPVLVVDEGSVVVARPAHRAAVARASTAARPSRTIEPSRPPQARPAPRTEVAPPAEPIEMRAEPVERSVPPMAFDEPLSIPRRRAWPLMAFAATAAVAVVALFALWPRSGEVVVRLRTPAGGAPDEVEIFLDGERVCTAEPCRLGDLAPGTYELKAVASGRPPAASSVTITAGSVSEAWLELAPAQRLEADAGAPGARLAVDGVDRGSLPAQIDDLAPGPHTVRITAPGHRPFERAVDLAPDQRLDLGLVALEAAPATVAIEVETAGAYVVLVDAREHKRVLRGPWPLKLELEPGRYQLLATRSGFVPFVAPIEAAAGRESSLRVVLQRTTKKPADAAPASPPPNELPADIADDIRNPYADRL